MVDFLDVLAKDVKNTIKSGYYRCASTKQSKYSLKKKIINCKENPIISEIKLSSPSGTIMKKNLSVVDIASNMIKGGVVGISIVTEPKHFKGSINCFKLIRESTQIPLLMKDFILSKEQINAAFRIGANAILLIQSLFDRNYCDHSPEKMIEYAHSFNIEILLETHNEEEFKRAVSTNADLIGINNRDLRNFSIDLSITKKILTKHNCHDRIVVAESGIRSPAHIRYLRDSGARAFLIGSSIMSVDNIEEKVREFVEA